MRSGDRHDRRDIFDVAVQQDSFSRRIRLTSNLVVAMARHKIEIGIIAVLVRSTLPLALYR
jgi:hypothetical protein